MLRTVEHATPVFLNPASSSGGIKAWQLAGDNVVDRRPSALLKEACRQSAAQVAAEIVHGAFPRHGTNLNNSKPM
jgi:hypothetical protein